MVLGILGLREDRESNLTIPRALAQMVKNDASVAELITQVGTWDELFAAAPEKWGKVMLETLGKVAVKFDLCFLLAVAYFIAFPWVAMRFSMSVKNEYIKLALNLVFLVVAIATVSVARMILQW